MQALFFLRRFSPTLNCRPLVTALLIPHSFEFSSSKHVELPPAGKSVLVTGMPWLWDDQVRKSVIRGLSDGIGALQAKLRQETPCCQYAVMCKSTMFASSALFFLCVLRLPACLAEQDITRAESRRKQTSITATHFLCQSCLPVY